MASRTCEHCGSVCHSPWRSRCDNPTCREAARRDLRRIAREAVVALQPELTAIARRGLD